MKDNPQFLTFLAAIRQRRIDQYARNKFTFAVPQVEIEDGQKMIRIVFCETHTGATKPSHHSACAFIAKVDFETKFLGKVKAGDVMKSASYKAPAKHARGNIFDAQNGLGAWGDYGPNYLKG